MRVYIAKTGDAIFSARQHIAYA